MQTSSEALDAPAIPELLILPKQGGKNAFLANLSHPRTGQPTRYYVCPDTGFYEFVKISVPKSSLTSLFLSNQYQSKKEEARANQSDIISDEAQQDADSVQYISQLAKVLVATPLDPLFLLLPILIPAPQLSKEEPRTTPFLSFDHLSEQLAQLSAHFHAILSHPSLLERLRERIEKISDAVQAGDERMYRVNNDKLMEELFGKAKRMTMHGLPPSMEEHFVRKALEIPVMSTNVCPSPAHDVCNIERSSSKSPAATSTESQSSNRSLSTENSFASECTATSISEEPDQIQVHPEVVTQLRLRTAIQYMVSAYCRPDIASSLTALITATASPLDLRLCEKHLARIAALRGAAQASRSLADFSLKRCKYEDDEAAESRAGKKRKKEEEQKAKTATLSRGLRDLKKVNTAGMKKMSDFFGKALKPQGQ
jgi:hypothetical protein